MVDQDYGFVASKDKMVYNFDFVLQSGLSLEINHVIESLDGNRLDLHQPVLWWTSPHQFPPWFCFNTTAGHLTRAYCPHKPIRVKHSFTHFNHE